MLGIIRKSGQFKRQRCAYGCFLLNTASFRLWERIFCLTVSVVLFAALTLYSTTMADDSALREVADAGNQFANHFGKTVVKGQNTNLIYSPLSAQVVLAMAAYGANGTTATEMRSVLHLPSDDAKGLDGYESLMKLLNAVTNVDLSLANKIYVGMGFELKPAFAALTTNKFLSTSETVDFGQPALAATTINAWCSAQTNNRIRDLISPDSLHSDTKLVLLNAVYFKGQWIEKFDPALTQDRPFHVDEKTTKNVATMYIKDRFRFGDIPEMNARFIVLPYEGHEMSMIIILPNEINGLRQVLDNLQQVNLTEILRRGYSRKVELFLPKFKIEITLDLEDVLKKMGMGTMFTNNANFSGISDIPLRVSKILQKAFIEVNEEGSEAAAVTAVEAVCYSACTSVTPPEQFIINRPFYYMIHHDGQRISLFNGNVHEPKSQ